MVNEGFEYKGYKITGCLENDIIKNSIDNNNITKTQNKALNFILSLQIYILYNPSYYDNTIIINSSSMSSNNDLYNEIKHFNHEKYGHFAYFYNIPEEELFYLKLKYNLKKSFFKSIKDINLEKIPLC